VNNYKYVLDESGRPVPEPDTMRWGEWYEQSWPARRVARTEVGDVHVSTVFLAMDHNWFGDGPPILYETMVFGGDRDGYQWRHHTREQAIAAHDQIVAALRAGQDPNESVP